MASNSEPTNRDLAGTSTPTAPPMPFSQARREQIEAGDFPPYHSMSQAELQAEFEQRGMEKSGASSLIDFPKPRHQPGSICVWENRYPYSVYPYSFALKESDRLDRAMYNFRTKLHSHQYPALKEYYHNELETGYLNAQAEIKEVLRNREHLMFQSTFYQDTGRKCFLDLPAEIRNMIYEEAIFGQKNAEGSVERKWVLLPAHGKLKVLFLPSNDASRQRHNPAIFKYEMIISTLRMLGAMSKQIISEVRSLFWSILVPVVQDSDKGQHESLRHFLISIGAEARAGIKNLEGRTKAMGIGGIDIGLSGYTSYQKLLPVLSSCKNLRQVRLGVDIANLFTDEIAYGYGALPNHFTNRQPLRRTGLETLRSTLCSLPLLENVDLTLHSWKTCRHLKLNSNDPFPLFVFSGARESMLRMVIYDRLQARDVDGQSDSSFTEVGR
ncbi:hypothetical protein BDW02DRAFT_37896 [Decorospora gaudefroyi]|uniref:Uncharacterized protein n=1 Tax=Decorospora gaudefroyi TaxID=184978 RepID=A0A6A5KAK7_9PLEO|nr:hypothetical protein BDW02DRAFT_37896 [Decorospora gaudefroyi]